MIIMHLLQYSLLLLAVGSICGQNGRKLVFTNVTFSSDEKYWHFSVWLNESRFSTIITAKENTIGVTNVFKLFVNTGGANGEFINFFNKHVDFCHALDNPISDPFVNMFHHTLLMNKNNRLFRKCPILKVSKDK